MNPITHAATIRRRALAACFAAALAGCGSAPATHYALRAVDRSDGDRPLHPAALHVVVGPVAIPALVDRPELVVRGDGLRVEIRDGQRWAEPLRDAIPAVLVARLAHDLDRAWVSRLQDPQAGPAQVRIGIEIVRLELRPGREALVEARWSVRRVAADAPALVGGALARAPAAAGTDALVAALGSALQQLADTLGRELATLPDSEVAAQRSTP